MNREFEVSALGFGKISRRFDPDREVERWQYDDDPETFLEISVSEIRRIGADELAKRVLAWVDACDARDC